MIAEGTSDELKVRVGGERLEVTLSDPGQAQVAISALAEIAGDERPECPDRVLKMPLDPERGGIADAVRRLDDADVGIDDIALRRPTLDDVFMNLTGHAAEEDASPASGHERRPYA